MATPSDDDICVSQSLGGTSLCLLCLIHSRYIIMIVIIAVMIAVTGTAMTNVIPTATEMDRPTRE